MFFGQATDKPATTIGLLKYMNYVDGTVVPLPDVADGTIDVDTRLRGVVDETPALPAGIVALRQFTVGLANWRQTLCHFTRARSWFRVFEENVVIY
jgi:hypothetical protein